MESSLYYELRKPNKIDPHKKYPAIFLLHGMGSNEQNMFPLVHGLEEQMYIFSIRGPISQGPGFTFFTIEGYGKPHRDIFKQSLNQLTHFIEYATEQYPIDSEQVFLLGFSQGSILSMSLALTLGKKIKGIVALSGYLPKLVIEDYEIQPVDHLSVFISHGEMDGVLPYQWGVEAQEYFKKLEAKVSFYSYPEGHTISLKNHQDLLKWIQDQLLQ
ncbi:alpha/beta hydrolase [Niallia sp. Krafla_26]|uniref:alpha/beta hydrolase n=1 Tax=Niallia sp. Krafla_26 TaxID=3064703 RepID=UPI003D17705D